MSQENKNVNESANEQGAENKTPETEKKETPFDRFIKSAGYKGVLGFALGAAFVMAYDGIISDPAAKKAIEAGQAAVAELKKESVALQQEKLKLQDRLKGCESIARSGEVKIDESVKREALDKARMMFRGTNVEVAEIDRTAPKYVRIKGNSEGTPIYYDPVSQYLIVGLVLDSNDLQKAGEQVKAFTGGNQQ